MEVPVGPYKVDVVANEALTESRAVIENQLERTNHESPWKAHLLRRWPPSKNRDLDRSGVHGRTPPGDVTILS